MGTLYKALIQDLKVSIQDSTLIFPTQQTENKSIFLSNIDQVLNFHVQTVHFFPANPHFPPEVAFDRLKNALEKLMATYDFLAGRLRLNCETGRLEIDCNGRGAGFVVANTEFCFDEIGDLVYPNPGFMQLIVQALDMFDDKPLCVFQVTSFKCGGFSLGISTNHVLFDGLSFKIFLQNLASQSFDNNKPLPIVPCNDRRLLAARSLPQVTFPHPELLKLDPSPTVNDDQTTSPMFDSEQDDIDFKIFNLSPDDINRLKEKAGLDGGGAHKITGFNIVAAHIWRCKALSTDYIKDQESMILYAVDIRSRLNPPLPASYCGNAVLSAYASAKCYELEEGPFSKLVDMVAEGADRMSDEYVRSGIDWGEVNKGYPNGDLFISSWWKLGFDEVVYPWGKARYSCPVVYRKKDIVLLFPEIGGVSRSNGVNVLVALPAKEMDKFQGLFYNYLA